MGAVWFALAAVMVAGYVVLDGFDFGAGALHLAVAKTDAERRQVLPCLFARDKIVVEIPAEPESVHVNVGDHHAVPRAQALLGDEPGDDLGGQARLRLERLLDDLGEDLEAALPEPGDLLEHALGRAGSKPAGSSTSVSWPGPSRATATRWTMRACPRTRMACRCWTAAWPGSIATCSPCTRQATT